MGSEPPTAVFARSDNMALGVLRAAERLEIEVPGQLSVVGFDDVQAASLETPSLTTVLQSLGDMGRAAVGLLYRRIDGKVIETPRIEVGSRLIVRDWTSALAST